MHFCVELRKLTKPGHSISYKIACTPTEDPDQSAHLRSLISLSRALLVAKEPKCLQAGSED